MSSTTSVIKQSTILFHNKEDGFQIYDKDDANKFGVFTLEIANTPITKETQQIHSENDISGSMQDPCTDGRTKMQHLNLTLENIVSLLSENADEANVIMGISGFDDRIKSVLESTKILNDPEKVKEIHGKIQAALKPRGMTNIMLALMNAKEKLLQAQDGDKSFIMMTDGQITVGENNKEILSEALPKGSDNYFVGFGKEHDFSLLQHLARNNNGNYFYVDKIENAGLVFGEIIHTILYPALKKATISITNGEIYDFSNNTWTTTLKIPTVCSEQKKHFHVRSRDPDNFELTISGTTSYGEESYNDSKLPYLINEDGTIDIVDLRKYMYRQKTLELLAQAKELVLNKKTYEEKIEMQKVLHDFRNEMKPFADEQTDEVDKAYMKQLLDDLYICEKTLHSEKALLYTIARQNAQGREGSNNLTQIEEIDILDRGVQDDEDNENYHISDCAINRSNTTPHQMKIMRTCSNQPNILEEAEAQAQAQAEAEAQAQAEAEYDNIPGPFPLERSNAVYNYADNHLHRS
jgi:hypothetical protein